MTEHRYPRRAAQKTKSDPFMGIAYWEQLTPDGEITVHYDGSYPPARSCWDNFDSLLNGNAHYGLVEIFDHHFPRYFEERASRGLHHRRRYTSNTHAVWADGVAPEYNLCEPKRQKWQTNPHGGHYDSLQSLEASQLFIETDANGVALDGSDEHARRINEGFDSYSFEIRKRQARIEHLEAEVFAKDEVNDEQRRIINRYYAEIIKLRQEVKKLKDDAHFTSASSLSSGRTITQLRAELIEMTKKYDNMLWSAKSYSNKCDSYEKAAQALMTARDEWSARAIRAEGDLKRIREVVA